mgnify:CR=1 FL=1
MKEGAVNGSHSKYKFDLQERLIDYAVRIVKVSTSLQRSYEGKHISGQLQRSGKSPAPKYGEAQGAESPADFIHKLKIALKELRETEVWLKIIVRTGLIEVSKLDPLIKGNR